VRERRASRAAVCPRVASDSDDDTGNSAAGCGFDGAEQISSLFLCDFERIFDELRVIMLFFFELGRFLSLDSRNQRGQYTNRLGYLPS
jgi:hypothetical protein